MFELVSSVYENETPCHDPENEHCVTVDTVDTSDGAPLDDSDQQERKAIEEVEAEAERAGGLATNVDDLEPVGQGALYAEFERIKARLAAEGLFDPELKRPLPEFPRCIGLVTSPTGAALRDILNVLRRRYPLAQVILSPTQVQGVDAPPQIVAALGAIAQQPVDVIILARGGGSLDSGDRLGGVCLDAEEYGGI